MADGFIVGSNPASSSLCPFVEQSLRKEREKAIRAALTWPAEGIFRQLLYFLERREI